MLDFILATSSAAINLLPDGFVREDMYAQDSIDLLSESGIQFKKHEAEGIEPTYFAELLMTSGIVLMDDVNWVSFHRWETIPVHAQNANWC